MMTIELIPVLAPDHPLAAIDGPIETLDPQGHVQLVLTDRSTLTAGRDDGVLSSRTWGLADLGATQSMLAGRTDGTDRGRRAASDVRSPPLSGRTRHPALRWGPASSPPPRRARPRGPVGALFLQAPPVATAVSAAAMPAWRSAMATPTGGPLKRRRSSPNHKASSSSTSPTA